jgi:hypothetical protein
VTFDPLTPGFFVGADRQLRTGTHQRQAQQSGVGQDTVEQLIVVHAQEAKPCIAVRTAGSVDQRSGTEALAETT